MTKGVLYGVGVGPGDPGLLTLKAVETIKKCGTVAAPRTPGGRTFALDTVRQAMDLEGKTILLLDFAMSPDPDVRHASHTAAAGRLRAILDAGESVAMPSLGDVSIYSSFHYVADLLAVEGFVTAMIPGVPSFCAAAAALGVSLTDMATPLHIVPDGDGEAAMPPDANAVTVYMKSGRHLPRLLSRLRECGRLADASLVQDCGLPGQNIVSEIGDGDYGTKYFSLVVVNPAKNAVPPAGNDAGVFDKKQLLTMSGDDEELAAEVAGMFLDDIPRQLTALADAFAQGDRAAAERVAHTVKGASAMVGGERLRAAAEAGEKLAHKGDMTGAEANLAEIKARYDELKSILEAEGYKPAADGQ